MAMTINTNIASTSAQRHLNESRRDLDLAMERLSSGQRINSAKDDAAGLAIRDKMSSQIVGLNQSIRNANDAISLAQTAEGAMEESVSILQRMRVLAMQAVNDTNTDSDRANLNDEFTQLQLELTRIGITSSFNNVKLLDGTFTGSTFQVGPGASETIFLKISDQKANAIGTTYDVASFDIFAANSPAKGDSVNLTIRGADGNGGDLKVTYTASKAESAIQTASGMVLALNSNSTFTQSYQALSDANNSILIRRTDGTSMGLPVRAQFDVTQAQVNDTVKVTVDGVATGGAAKDFTYTVESGKTSATDISTGVAAKLNADVNGFGRFYKAYASSYASTDVTLTVGTAIENNQTAAVTIDGTTFTTAELSANATASDIGDAFAALSETGWDISNNKGVVTFYKNADYSKASETGQSVITTADAPTVTIAGTGSGAVTAAAVDNLADGKVEIRAKDGTTVDTSKIKVEQKLENGVNTYASTKVTLTVASTIEAGQTASITIDSQVFETGTLSASATANDIGAAFDALSVTGWDIVNNSGAVTFSKNADYVGGTTGGSGGDDGQDAITGTPAVTIAPTGSSGTVTVAHVHSAAGVTAGAVAAGTTSKVINEHTGFEVTVAAASGLSVSSVVKAVDVFVDDTDVLSASAAMEAVRVVDDAVAMVGRERAGLGAFQNRLEHAMSNMANNSQNTQAARSVIADADYAKEAAVLAKNQILQQAGTAMLAQANSQSETVLSLLK